MYNFLRWLLPFLVIYIFMITFVFTGDYSILERLFMAFVANYLAEAVLAVQVYLDRS